MNLEIVSFLEAEANFLLNVGKPGNELGTSYSNMYDNKDLLYYP